MEEEIEEAIEVEQEVRPEEVEELEEVAEDVPWDPNILKPLKAHVMSIINLVQRHGHVQTGITAQ